MPYHDKIIAKLVGSRLATILPKLISLNQGAFARERSVFDIIYLTQEICREIGKSRGRLTWWWLLIWTKPMIAWSGTSSSKCFIILALPSIGNIIRACISSCQFFVIFQGKVNGVFSSSRGLPQSDPLFPSLFILVEVLLSCMVNSKISCLEAFSTTWAKCHSYLLFADDIMHFSSAKRRAIMKFMKVLEDYSKASGQRINGYKCNFFLSANARNSRVHVVKAATNFARGYTIFPSFTWVC